MVAIGSVNAEGELSERNATGKELEVVAPGEKVSSTSAFDGVMACGGTSISAPHVTGVASVLWQKDLNMSADFVRKLLRSTAKKIKNEDDCGYGVIDLNKATKEYENVKKKYKSEPQKTIINVSSNEENLISYDKVDYVEGYFLLYIKGVSYIIILFGIIRKLRKTPWYKIRSMTLNG